MNLLKNMLKIKYTKPFLKQFKKLSPILKIKTQTAIKKFQKNPKDSSLKTHKLHGELANFYSFSVDFNYRIVFEINKKEGNFVFLKIGNHEVYK